MKIQIFALVACAVAMATALTPCQELLASKNKDSAAGMVGAFIPKCEDDGTYSALQCHPSTGYCWCAREDGSQINEPARGKYEACNCVRHRDTAQKQGLIGTYRPQCQANGHYAQSQCWGSVGACWCVDEKTGSKVSNNPWDC